MFTFTDDIPTNIRAFLVSRLQAWIERAIQPAFSMATKYGLVTFRRSPWPIDGPTVVSPAGEIDKAILLKFSQGV